MSKINIDEIVEAIEITVGGKKYTLDDIPRDIIRKIRRLGKRADLLEKSIDAAEDFVVEAEKTGNTDEIKRAGKALSVLAEREENEDSTGMMVTVMATVLKAEEEDIKKLGMRKLTMLVQKVIGTLNEELDPKNAPKVVAVK